MRYSKILELHSEGKKTVEIAEAVGCTERNVRKCLQRQRQLESEEREESQWFRRIIKTKLADLNAHIGAAAVASSGVGTSFSTDLANPDKIRLISSKELSSNTYPHSWTDKNDHGKGSEWIREHLSGSKKSSHGFIIKKDEVFESSEDFIRLLGRDEYQKQFTTIFQNLQSKKKPRGDGKRKQAKMKSLLQVAISNVKQAQAAVNRRKKEGPEMEDARNLLLKKEAELELMTGMLEHQKRVYEEVFKVSTAQHAV